MTTSYIEEKAYGLLKEVNSHVPPIDVYKIATLQNVQITEIETGDDVSGFFVIKNNKPIIGVNKGETMNRMRFTIAHELAHYLLHSKKTPLFIDKKESVKFNRDNNSKTGEIEIEREANAFAAALLMPKHLLVDELNRDTNEKISIRSLAKKFEVSEQAMAFRLANLGLLDVGL